MTPWRDVKSWCDGGNSRYGDCFLAIFGNRLAQTTGQVMSDAEVLEAANQIEGLSVLDPSTDRGITFEAGLTKLQARGWPPDSELTVKSWRTITLAELPVSLAAEKMVGAALMLPMTADGTDYDFSDDPLARKATPVGGHAVLVVDAAPFIFVTWARPQGISAAWWATYGIQLYEIAFGDAA